MFKRLLDWLRRLAFGGKEKKSTAPGVSEVAESRAEKIFEELRRCEEGLQRTAEELAESSQELLEQLRLQQEALAAMEVLPVDERDPLPTEERPEAGEAEDPGTEEQQEGSAGEVEELVRSVLEEVELESSGETREGAEGAGAEEEREEAGEEAEEEDEDSDPEEVDLKFLEETETASAPPPSEEGTDVVIGLDFGTSRCKVVLRAPYMAGSPAYPVLFDFIEDEPLLLPTEVYRAAGGALSLEEAEGSELIRGLKVALLDNPLGEESKANVVGYLALVLRYAREWFTRVHSESFGHLQIYWSVNLGLPSSGSKDRGMREDFQQVLEAAWQLSVTENECTVQAAQAALAGGGEALEGEATLLLREEVIAEVQGYCRSYMKQLGLHLMVDVGASTLDVCGFTLYKRPDGGPGQALLVPVVERLGILHLLRAKDETGRPSDEFRKDCRRALYKVLSKLIKYKDPNAPAFRQGEQLRVFLCGGGSLDPFYRQVVLEVEKILKERMLAFGGFAIQPIPMHEEIQWPGEIEQSHYHRLAVAFGLSFFDDEVGDICPPDTIDDIDPPDVEPEADSIGKEQV